MIVIEIQSNGGEPSAIVTTHETRAEAEQKYHQTLAYAAVSAVRCHSVVMLDERGTRIKGETYTHGTLES